MCQQRWPGKPADYNACGQEQKYYAAGVHAQLLVQKLKDIVVVVVVVVGQPGVAIGPCLQTVALLSYLPRFETSEEGESRVDQHLAWERQRQRRTTKKHS